jgi:hypothetical protein
MPRGMVELRSGVSKKIARPVDAITSQFSPEELKMSTVGSEGQAFESNAKDHTHAFADFSSTLVEQGRLEKGALAGSDQGLLAATLLDPILKMRTALQNVANSSCGGEFSEFLADCRQKSAAGEPVYRLLMGEQLT